MASSLAWLDFSEHERRKTLDVIDLFREREARDELGIGTVRDALSDVLFPGVSTIQTRARYFLFIPWIYQSLERKRNVAPDIERLARREEIRLIDALADAGETDGVIGIDARAGLKRLPSHVYWQGLHAWGLRRIPVSQSEYHRFFSRFSAPGRGAESSEDEGDRGAASRRMWHEELPYPPDDFPQVASFSFRKSEAEYLRERLLARQSGKLLTFIVDRWKAPSECDFPWEHPQLADFPERNRDQLEHARRFSLAMYGAALMYNLMLCELLGSEEGVERYRTDVAEWVSDVAAERAALEAWDRLAFWQLAKSENPRISHPTQSFVNTWFDLAIGNTQTASAFRERSDVRALVANREKRLKGPQSRFANNNALRLWGGESGAYRLSYRWFQVQRIVNDIGRGLVNA
jgi:hypothetical protein